MVSRTLPSRPPAPPRWPHLVWALCTVARSGSTWLADLVSSTRQLGDPQEYLLDWRRQLASHLPPNASLSDYLQLLMPQHTSPNGVFAVNGSLAELVPWLELFPAAPCVWLSRRNKCAQAVSWYRAHCGGRWSRLVETSAATSHLPPLDYSTPRLLWFYDEILRREAAWQHWFTARRTQPLCLIYEEVCDDPDGAVRAIAQFVGIDPDSLGPLTSLRQIVRDELSDAWVTRLTEEVAQRSSAPASPASANEEPPLWYNS